LGFFPLTCWRVTAESEPPAERQDDPAEIAALKQLVRERLEKLDQPPYLGQDTTLELLEEIAFASRNTDGQAPGLTELATKSSVPEWPAELGEPEKREIITGLLGECGLLVATDEDFRFADRTVHEYLAAAHIVRRQPGGPHIWDQHPWRYLAPQESWPWPDAAVKLFVTALWRPNARSRVDRRLRRLLNTRNRHPNIRFVIELIRRDLLPESDLPERTVAILDAELVDGKQDESRWQAMAGALRVLDPERADAKLEDLFRNPPEAITSQRRFAAVDELTRHDPALGARNLRFLADNPTGTPEENLENAALIAARDHEEGVRARRLLANTPDMGESRVEAAIDVDSPELLAELIEHPRGLSDAGRLKLSGALLEREPATAVTAMVKFARTAGAQDTPLRLAEMIQPHQPRMSLLLATEVAWPAEKEIDSQVRLRAVLLIGEIDGGQATTALHRLSGDRSVSGEVRLVAAKRIAEDGGPITALVELADDPELTRTYRVEGARVAGILEPETGARLYISIATTHAPTGSGELALLAEAHKLSPGPAEEALSEVAGDSRVKGAIRVEAVEIASQTLTRRRVITLYTTIATTSDIGTALTAARKVAMMDTTAGQLLMGTLARQNTADITFQLTAALEAGVHAVPILTNLAQAAKDDNVRLKASRGLYDVDKASGIAALQDLVKKSGAGDVRIDAALSLPKKLATDALIVIAGDSGDDEEIRFGAAVKAMGFDGKQGRQALRDLGDAEDVSPATREKVRKQLA
jgi:hypothetical protein